MSDNRLVLIAILFSALICTLAWVWLMRRIMRNVSTVEDASETLSTVGLVIGLFCAPIVFVIGFNLGMPIYGTHNSIGTFFFGAFINFFLSQGLAHLGKSLFGRLNL